MEGAEAEENAPAVWIRMRRPLPHQLGEINQTIGPGFNILCHLGHDNVRVYTLGRTRGGRFPEFALMPLHFHIEGNPGEHIHQHAPSPLSGGKSRNTPAAPPFKPIWPLAEAGRAGKSMRMVWRRVTNRAKRKLLYSADPNHFLLCFPRAIPPQIFRLTAVFLNAFMTAPLCTRSHAVKSVRSSS